MPKPSQRTRSRRRKSVKLPGKGATLHFKKERVGASHCVQCGKVLPSVPMLTPSKMRGLPASQRRLQRMFGGQLCQVCLNLALKRTVRSGSTS